MPLRADGPSRFGLRGWSIEPVVGALLVLFTFSAFWGRLTWSHVALIAIMLCATIILPRKHGIASLIALAHIVGWLALPLPWTLMNLGTSLFVYNWMYHRRRGRWWLAVADPVLQTAMWTMRHSWDDWAANFLGFSGVTAFAAVAGQLACRRREAQDQAMRQGEKALRSTRLLMASELHDSVAQTQALLVMHLEELADDPHLSEDLTPQVIEALELSRAAARELREAMAALRNVDQDFRFLGRPGGHSLAQQWDQVQEALTDSGFNPQTRFDIGDLTLSPELEHTISRTLGELVANLVWHGAPGECIVEVLEDQGSIVIRTQNEIGSDSPAKSGGDGLVGMSQRVTMLGGTCSFGPHGSLWRATVTIPLPRTDAVKA